MAPCGFRSYMRNNYNNPPIYYKIKIEEEIKRFTEQNIGVTQPLIIIEATSIRSLPRFGYKLEDYISGGEYKQFSKRIENFMKLLKSLNVKIVVFFSGSKNNRNNEERNWGKIRIEKCHRVLDALYAKDYDMINGRDLALPTGLTGVIRRSIRPFCEDIIISVFRECREEMVEYANAHNAMAILSEDYNCVIAQGAWSFWSIANTDLEKKTTWKYDKERLATNLKLLVKQLPLFRTLLGNEYIEKAALDHPLQEWHNRLRRQNKPLFYWKSHIVPLVANYVCKYKDMSEEDIEEISMEIFNDKEKATVIKTSVASYCCVIPSTEEYLTDNEEWNEILTLALNRHKCGDFMTSNLNILLGFKNKLNNSWVDLRKNDLPISQFLWLPLRKKIYGILLQNCPCKREIEEWINDNVNGIDKPFFYEPIPPVIDLKGYHTLDFWNNEKGANEEITDLSWKLFVHTISSDLPVDRVRALSHVLITPILSIIQMIKPCNLSHHEIEAFLLVAVLCSMHNDLSSIVKKSLQIDPKALRLSSIYVRGIISIRQLLQSIGCVFPISCTRLEKVFDGALFNFFCAEYVDMQEYKHNEEFIKGLTFITDFQNIFFFK